VFTGSVEFTAAWNLGLRRHSE